MITVGREVRLATAKITSGKQISNGERVFIVSSPGHNNVELKPKRGVLGVPSRPQIEPDTARFASNNNTPPGLLECER